MYFVTFRLADSLPRTVLEQIGQRKQLLESARRAGRTLLPCETVALAELTAVRIEALLDSGGGSCALRNPQIANSVEQALERWNGARYDLAVYCIMPNHVHAVVRVASGESLPRLLSSWKSYTANVANATLNRTGHFWQREYYDRLIRSGDEFERAIEYVRTNPQRAWLRDWKWVKVDARVCECILGGCEVPR